MDNLIPVHITHPPDKESLSLLRELLNSKITLSTGSSIENKQMLQYLVNGRPKEDLLRSCPNLRAVIVPFAGIPAATQTVMQKFPHLQLHNLHHNAIPVVEHTLALLLAVCKHIIQPHNALSRNDWRPRYAANPTILLTGKTALLLGYGAIGSRLAKILHALDIQILAIRNTIKTIGRDRFATIYPSHSLDKLLPQADIMINTLPLTKDTQGMIGERELSLLPRGAVVVNIGRGKVIKQDAFYHALESGHLGGAAIDVWYHYPENEEDRTDTPPADYPFGKLDHVVLSPHRAGGLHSNATERLRMEHLAALLNHTARGETLPNRVDINKGY